MADTTKVALIVGDDLVQRDRVARELTDAGFDVVTAGDNQEALAIARMLHDRLGLVVVGSAIEKDQSPPDRRKKPRAKGE